MVWVTVIWAFGSVLRSTTLLPWTTPSFNPISIILNSLRHNLFDHLEYFTDFIRAKLMYITTIAANRTIAISLATVNKSKDYNISILTVKNS